ncbi:MAG: hypothetical protein R6T98_04075 [Desulfatiglandales bacterium]
MTGERVLSFRNLSMGEPTGSDLSGQCGVSKIYPLAGSPLDAFLKRPTREP